MVECKNSLVEGIYWIVPVFSIKEFFNVICNIIFVKLKHHKK